MCVYRYSSLELACAVVVTHIFTLLLCVVLGEREAPGRPGLATAGLGGGGEAEASSSAVQNDDDDAEKQGENVCHDEGTRQLHRAVPVHAHGWIS